MSMQIPLSLALNKMNQFDDFVRCQSRFLSLSLLIKSTMLMISLDVYADSRLSRF